MFSLGDDEDESKGSGDRFPTDDSGDGANNFTDRRQNMTRRGSVLRRNTLRADRLQNLALKEKIRSRRFSKSVRGFARLTMKPDELAASIEMAKADLESTEYELEREDDEILEKLRKEVDEEEKVLSAKLTELHNILEKAGIEFFFELAQYPLEVRVSNLSVDVPIDEATGKIMTVFNSSYFYLRPILKFFRRLKRGESVLQSDPARRKRILDNINLVLQPGKSYLIMGPPSCGKTTLLKVISGLCQPSRKMKFEGRITYNGRSLKEKDEFYIENVFAYIGQLDKHAPRLTVGETLSFAYQCKSAGKMIREDLSGEPDERREAIERAGKDEVSVNVTLAGLGLSEVKGTFVGDTFIRGVSGGQRRRVTVGEMLTSQASVLCGDEISTGLDATSTYDMVQVLLYFGRLSMLTRIFSLLQPSPETVSLFDEIIVLADGMIIYAGPVSEVEDYFAEIGFQCPSFVDVADFLQMVSTEDGGALYDASSSVRRKDPMAPSPYELANLFRESALGKRIRDRLEAPHEYVWTLGDDNASSHGLSRVSRLSKSKLVMQKYANNFFRSTMLVLRRFLTLWIRDKRVLIAGAAKNILMGISVGGVYLSSTDPLSIQGALFQATLFIILGAMQGAAALVTDRTIFYKHTDANFYSAWPFAFGRALSQVPQTTSDTIVFSTILYFMVGLAGRQSASNFFIYLFLLLVFAVLIIQQLAFFASFASSSSLNAYSACVVLLLILFGGFIIPPVAIPDYYTWLYWWNPLAWTYRALVVNEFRSGVWANPNEILSNSGMIGPGGEPYSIEWVGYSFAYTIPYTLLCLVVTALGLTYLRSEGIKATVQTSDAASSKSSCLSEKVESIPFKPVTLSFRDVCYDVTASTSKEKLRILKSVSGIFHYGRMCALMGSSGAGKTTLLDVIALRKHSGTISGQVCLNGWPQEKESFRRCSGMVEQFDVQSPELTIRETVLFSAKLRLDASLVESDDDIQAFVDHVLDEVELYKLRDTLVGTDEGAGLSFEQTKRLSIAVELAASPSILFLDEPTSGLDARSAMIVCKTLRRIADGGRTIIATIHQPSSAVFCMFDDLLLLKKGGEVVYHGPLGDQDSNRLVAHFEQCGADPIELGDNPANWMLREMASPRTGDLAAKYLDCLLYVDLMAQLDELHGTPIPEAKIEFESDFATSGWTRRAQINRRLRTIYWRSPAYNLTRLVVSMGIAFILGSSFVTQRDPGAFTETDMRARVATIFLSFIIIGIMAMLSVLPVMTKIRDMFYRHRDAGMYDSASMGLALGTTEKWFIVLSTIVFTTVFLPPAGIVATSERFIIRFGRCVAFWGFFTFNFAIYSYFGQLFVCLVKPLATAIILSSVFIGLNNFFAGLIVRPQFMVGTFYALPFYICPGHYIYDGLITAIYHRNPDIVVADLQSEFRVYLVRTGTCTIDQITCNGTASEYVDSFFGGQYNNGFGLSGIVCGFILILVRVLTWVALKYVRFS